MGDHDFGHHDHTHGHDHGDHAHPTALTVDTTRDLTWEQETIELSTVGIDIGSATMHLTFARVFLQRVGQLMSDRFTVVRRDVGWQSPVSLTPYVDADEIDAKAVREFIEFSYAAGDINPREVDTGAVLLTGVALLRRNAESLTRELAAYAGDFVCAAASHHMEALLAAQGSGAVDVSRARPGRVLSLDIGGGTSKFTWLRDGRIDGTAAVGVGGRLVTWTPTGTVTRAEHSATQVAEAVGQALEAGRDLSDDERRRLARSMASVLGDAVQGRLGPLGRELALTDWPDNVDTPATVVLSGGVAEYLRADGAPEAPTDDLGRALATELRRELDARRVPWQLGATAIRATVLGAAGYSVDISGNTVHVGEPGLLPVRDVPVVTAVARSSDSADDVARELARSLDGQADGITRPLAVYLQLRGEWVTYQQVRRLADAIAAAWRPRRERFADLLVLVMQSDLARSLGRMLEHECELGSRLVCLDGIQLTALDFIDIGTERRGVHPVVIKSLLFESTGAPTTLPTPH